MCIEEEEEKQGKEESKKRKEEGQRKFIFVASTIDHTEVSRQARPLKEVCIAILHHSQDAEM